MSVPALDVAGFLIHLAASEDEPEYLTHLRLQKLLYYVQGWSLGLRNLPMFPERIEAWAHGPVVKDLYHFFKDFSSQPIDPRMVETVALPQEDAQFVSEVWEAYKPYSAASLREMTHNEPPWVEARGTAAPADHCSAEITHDAMRRYFTSAQS